jgi:hypothetical protein
MPNLLDGVLGDDAHFAFTNGDEFAEQVTYTPVSGVARTIVAVIDRNPPEMQDANGKLFRPKLTALIQNHATRGVTSIDAGGDSLAVALRYGGAAVAHSVGLPLKGDAGCWLVPLY